jgi:hypothetical protein
MIQLYKVCALELRPRGYSNLSWSEEYRKTVDVDGELSWVRIISSLAAKIPALPASCNFSVGPQMSLYINHATDSPRIARGPRHSWGRAIYSPQ